jgi:hypothetical protein
LLCIPLALLVGYKRKRNKIKGAFSKVFFSKAENQFCFAKIFPGFQDFLTQNKTYNAEKDSKALL